MNATRKTVIAALFLSLLFVAAAPAVQSENGAVSATDASMTLMPERDAVYTGETFNVSVWIQADNVSGLQARIGFNQSVFHATNVTLADTSLNLYMQSGSGFNGTIDNDKGIVGDIIGFTSSPVNATGGLKIATVTFEVNVSTGCMSSIHFIEDHCEIDSYDVGFTNATMKVNPVDVAIEPSHRLIGDTSTTYNVNVTPNGNAIRAMNFMPVYDPAYVNVTDVTPDGLFPIVEYNATKNVALALHPTDTVTANGTAAIIHCTPLQTGTSAITLTDFTVVGNTTLPVNLEQPEATLEADIDPPNVTMEVGQPRMDPIDLTNQTYGLRTHIYDSGAFNMFTWPADLALLYPGFESAHQTISVDGTNYSTMGNLSTYATTTLTQTGPNTAYIEYMLPMNVWARFDFQLVQNATKFIITTENQDDTAHDIGVKWYYDTQVADNDGAPIYIPGQGVQTHEKTYYNPTFEYFSGYDQIVDPTLVSTGWISPSKGATMPDVVMLSSWPDSSGEEWWYETDPTQDFTGDSAVALYWNETTVAPSASREIVTFYGIGEPLATGNFSVVDIYLDDPTGEYQVGETATISVDTVAAGQDFDGSVRLVVSNDGTEYFNQSKAVSMNAGDVNTTTFDFTIPDLPGEYLDVKAILYNQTDPAVDSRTEENLVHISSGVAFTISNVYPDKFTYSVNETAAISVDTAAVGQAFTGTVRLIVYHDGTEYLNHTVPVSMAAGEANTTTFGLTIPDLPGTYLDAQATLYNETGVAIDTRTEGNLLFISAYEKTFYYVTSATPLYINATDEHDYHISYRLWNGTWGEWQQGPMNTDLVISLSEGGTHYIEYYAEDAYNNTSPTGNKTIYVDTMPPHIADNTPSTATTGDSFTFNASITDEGIGLSEVYVEYWYGDGEPSNVSMSNVAGDFWEYTLTVPSDVLDPLHYTIAANDSFNYWGHLTREVTITDNDKPTYTWIDKPLAGTTGESATVTVAATDNIGIDTAEIVVSGTTHAMQKNGDQYAYTITIPGGSTSSITYYCTFADAADNTVTTSSATITVTDNDSPTINATSGNVTVGTGNTVTLWVNGTDNINVTAATVTIDGTDYDMVWNSSRSRWEYDYTAPANSAADHAYNATIFDEAGNNVTSDTYTITVTDDDSPTWSSFTGPSGTIHTSSVSFSWRASDNLGTIEYSYILEGYDSGWSNWRSATSKSYSALDDGSYTFKVRARDAAGNTPSPSLRTKSFTVDTNAPPTAKFSVSPDEPTDVDPVTFNASASSDSDGTIASYTWDFGDGDTGTGETASHTYDDNGTYTVMLTVEDDNGDTDTTTKQVNVTNEPPEALFTTDPADTAEIDEGVLFNSTLSRDEDGDIVSYAWDFGDGNTSDQANPTHAYEEDGDYNVTLTVTDNDGDTSTTTVTLAIEEEPPDYLLPIIAIIVLVIIAIAVVLVWRRRSMSGE